MITAESHEAVTVVTIDRHERRNALDLEHAVDLRSAVVAALDGGARALVVTGAGSSFCSGADLDAVYSDEFRVALAALLRTLAAAAVPIVAAVNGPAMGAGTQIAVACDLRVVSDTAKFAVPTARNGLAVDPWTVARLADVAGGGLARAMLIGADTVSADRALAAGLADRAGGPDDALAWATELATLAPLSLRYAKTALNAAVQRTPEDDVQAAFTACWASADVVEARTARGERRPPVFTGR